MQHNKFSSYSLNVFIYPNVTTLALLLKSQLFTLLLVYNLAIQARSEWSDIPEYYDVVGWLMEKKYSKSMVTK